MTDPHLAEEAANNSKRSVTFGGRERFWMPKLWHGMSAGAWWKLLMRNRFQVAPRYWFTALTVTPATWHNSFLRIIQNLIYRKLDQQNLPFDPIFIIGHWRSGTTLLHELMGLDELLTFPTTYECYSPNHFLISERWASRALGFLLPKQRLPDNMEQGWGKPQEDEAALCNLGARSAFLKVAFPNLPLPTGESYDVDELTPREREQWSRILMRFLKEISVRRPRRIVLKSPAHTFRIQHLLRLFPDARFIYIYRNPFEVFPSSRRLWTTLYRSQGLQAANFEDLEENIFTTYEELFTKYESTRNLIPTGRLSEIRYESLVENPVEELRRVYQEIELDHFPSIEPALNHYRSEMADYQPNRYVLDSREQRQIESRWREAIQRYDYHPPV